MRKLLFRLLAVFFFVAGLLALYSGYLYRSPQDGVADGALIIPIVADVAVSVVGPIAKQSQFWAFATREMLGASNHGLLPVLAAVGILALFLGFISLIISISGKGTSGTTTKKKEATVAAKASSEPATNQTTADALDVSDKTESSDDTPVSIPIGGKDADEETDNKQQTHTVEGFEDINKIISLSYSHLSEDKRSVIFQKFRPDLAPYLGLMTELAQNKLAKQILLHYVLKHNRSEENIDSSQFRAQDTRMNEAERETIMRRFLPQKPEVVNADGAKLIGNVYEITEQPEIQHKTFTDAEDWQDVSLRNALDMLQMPAPGKSNGA